MLTDLVKHVGRHLSGHRVSDDMSDTVVNLVKQCFNISVFSIAALWLLSSCFNRSLTTVSSCCNWWLQHSK